MYFKIILALVFNFVLNIKCNERPKVLVKQGEMEGMELTSINGTTFFAFRGIPYGKPPVGPLRFKLPEAASAWEGLLDASKDGPVCAQLDFEDYHFIGDEDCLHLNVYTPKIPSDDDDGMKLPVLVYIHGGGFFGGSGTSNFTGPYRIMDREIVFVAMNYRLNALGFLNTEDSVSPGNYGLWDQRLALQWIKDNIRAFGGNPDQITISGISAGAASVSYHLISSASKGLFHGAILQSGSALCNWGFQATPKKAAQRLAKDVDCPQTPSQDLIECLRQKSPEAILKPIPSYMDTSIFPLLFVPSLELSDDPKFFDDVPVNLFRYGSINRVPIIIGFTNSEGLEFALTHLRKMTSLNEEDLKKYTTNLFVKAGGIDEKDVPKALEFYGNLNDTSDPSFLSTFAEAASDATFAAGVEQTLIYLVQNNVPVYAYINEHEQKNSFVKSYLEENVTGVSHGDDENLLISSSNIYNPEELEGNDKEMSEKVKDLWISFATYGDPTPKNGTNVDVKWSPVLNGDKIDFLRIRLPLEMTSTSISEKRKFWNRMVNKYATKQRVCDEL